MTFQEFVEEPDFDDTIEELEEGVVRTGALIAFSGQSKTHGDKSERLFNSAISVLKTNSSKDDQIQQRLRNLEQALVFLCEGLIETRKQIGSGVSVNLTGHLLTSNSLKSFDNRRRR